MCRHNHRRIDINIITYVSGCVFMYLVVCLYRHTQPQKTTHGHTKPHANTCTNTHTNQAQIQTHWRTIRICVHRHRCECMGMRVNVRLWVWRPLCVLCVWRFLGSVYCWCILGVGWPPEVYRVFESLADRERQVEFQQGTWLGARVLRHLPVPWVIVVCAAIHLRQPDQGHCHEFRSWRVGLHAM